MQVFGPHFTILLNVKKSFKLDAAKYLAKREQMTCLDNPITWTEFLAALNNLKMTNQREKMEYHQMHLNAWTTTTKPKYLSSYAIFGMGK